MRAKPSDGRSLRLTRVLQGKYAVSVKDVARIMKVSHRQAQRYVEKLQQEGVIFVKYKKQRSNFYAIRRNK
jgi:Mn-dependent DtxR family transcriptional regulator